MKRETVNPHWLFLENKTLPYRVRITACDSSWCDHLRPTRSYRECILNCQGDSTVVGEVAKKYAPHSKRAEPFATAHTANRTTRVCTFCFVRGKGTASRYREAFEHRTQHRIQAGPPKKTFQRPNVTVQSENYHKRGTAYSRVSTMECDARSDWPSRHSQRFKVYDDEKYELLAVIF